MILSNFPFFAYLIIVSSISLEPYKKEDVQGKKIKKICFHSNQACGRGTEVALYDYADNAEKIFNVTSHIFFPDSNVLEALHLFKNRFNVTLYTIERKDIEGTTAGKYFLQLVVDTKCDFLYTMKYGTKEWAPAVQDLTPEVVPIGVHAVFQWEPHMSSYAAISPDVTGGVEGRAVVPHMVVAPDMESYLQKPGMRQELNIPVDAFVLCRHGGSDSFDVPFVHAVLRDVISAYPKLYVLLLNTNKFADHPRIRHLPYMGEIDRKQNFYRTCDAMIHARLDGETFGLAVAEFSVHNIPVITYPGKSKEHVRILGEKGFVYNNEQELRIILDTLQKSGIDRSKDFNAYCDYYPPKVMEIFKKVFLEPVFGPNMSFGKD